MATGRHQGQSLSRTPEHAPALAEELAGQGASVTAGAIDEQITGEVVVLATPYEAAVEFVQSAGETLNGKVVVEIRNPVDWASFDRLVTLGDSSAAEEVARWLPPGVPVVKAFITTFAGTLVEGEVAGQNLDMLIAGDDEGAKTTVADLVESGGLRPVDTGPLRRARQLEHLRFLLMALQDKLGTGCRSALKLISP